MTAKRPSPAGNQQKTTWQTSWSGASADISVCQALAVALQVGRAASRDVHWSTRLVRFTRLIDKTVVHFAGELRSTASKNSGEPIAIVLMCVDSLTTPQLSVSAPKVADMTRHTPPYVSACVQTCYRAGCYGNYCFSGCLWLMLRRNVVWWEHSRWGGVEEDMALALFLFALSSSALFTCDNTDSHSICS